MPRGILTIMAYSQGLSALNRVPFSGPQVYRKVTEDFTSQNAWKNREICHFGSKNAPKPHRQNFFRTRIGAREGTVRILGGCRPVLRILTLFQTKKCHFSHPFSELVSKKLCHHYLGLEQRQQKRFLNWNPFGIRIFLFLSSSFGIETIKTSIQTLT